MLYYIIGFIVWWYIGYKSFVHFWTGSRDLSISDRKFGYFLGMGGLITTLSCIMVYFITKGVNDDRTVKKKRNSS